ncbi:hypothetical protein Aduo_001087 [Ancylostoma duodenale]
MQDATNVGDRFEASPAEFVPSKCKGIMPSRQPVTELIHDLADGVSYERFDDLSSASEQLMVEELSSSNQNGMRNRTRMIQWHMRKSQNSSLLAPGSLCDGRFKEIPICTQQELCSCTPVESAIADEHCDFLTDFELPAITAAEQEMTIDFLG